MHWESSFVGASRHDSIQLRSAGRTASIEIEQALQIIELLLGPQWIAEPSAQFFQHALGALGGGNAHRVKTGMRIEGGIVGERPAERIRIAAALGLARSLLVTLLVASGALTFAAPLHRLGKLIGTLAQSLEGAALRLDRLAAAVLAGARALPARALALTLAAGVLPLVLALVRALVLPLVLPLVLVLVQCIFCVFHGFLRFGKAGLILPHLFQLPFHFFETVAQLLLAVVQILSAGALLALLVLRLIVWLPLLPRLVLLLVVAFLLLLAGLRFRLRLTVGFVAQCLLLARQPIEFAQSVVHGPRRRIGIAAMRHLQIFERVLQLLEHSLCVGAIAGTRHLLHPVEHGLQVLARHGPVLA
ncbi:MAG: hypothetical protein WAN31_09245, partial [Methylovirgula sp.]